MSKVSAWRVPKLLQENQKHCRIQMCQELLALSSRYGNKFWSRIVTTDETWIPYFNSETKEQSMEWRRPENGPTIKAQRVQSIGKVIITFFSGL